MKLMKLLFLFLLVMPFEASAQDSVKVKKNEIIVGVGSELFLSDDNWDDGYDEKTVYSIFVGYMRHLNKTWSIGVYFTYLSDDACCDETLYGPNGEIISYNTYLEKHKYFCLSANVKAKWARHHLWNFYSRLGLGPYLDISECDNADKNTKWHFGPQQITPVGFEIGNDNIKGFLELGVGVQGLVNIGLSHSF